jgi:hypothetical protein
MFDFSSALPYIIVLLVVLAGAAGVCMAKREFDELTGPIPPAAMKWRYYYDTPPPGKSQNWHEDNRAGIYKTWETMNTIPASNRDERANNRNLRRGLYA